MKEVQKRKKGKNVQPVNVPPQYTLGLGFNPNDPKQSLEAMLGKHQAKYMQNIFIEMNKFTKTAVMTVIPDLFAQLLNVLKGEKQRLVAEQLELEAIASEGCAEKIPVKNEIKVPIKEDKPPATTDETPQAQGETQKDNEAPPLKKV
jgi:hypothetical protein